jgi:hypothetical protein
MYRIEPADRPEKPSRSPEGKNSPQQTFIHGPTDVDACVASVIGRYLGHEALTMLKQSALNGGIGLGALASEFFLGHAIGGTVAAETMTDTLIGLGIKMDHLARAVQFMGGTVWAAFKLYPKLVRESFNNKKEAVRALRQCFN